ncbi:nucleoside/nucleotide kinase family protein [Mycoplasmopsis lipofaciens]|uniref:dephospho-CoA kinase n=1 Tax=Mycoplasmopsis lipofaciens TaxID=114884 RepID=UPI000480760E|nr:dephospho-CoA kinase [Mycoplasmopsis lipofaciens]
MIAVIGKTCVGKTTFLNYLKNKGFSIFILDEFVNDLYEKSEKFYTFILNNLGEKYCINNKIDKLKIRTLFNQKPEIIDLLEKGIYPLIFEHFQSYSYDFVEIPNLVNQKNDFSSFFSSILCLETSNKIRMKNAQKRNVDKLFIQEIDRKNDPKTIKNLLFGKIPIVDIYANNFTDIEKMQKIFQLLLPII